MCRGKDHGNRRCPHDTSEARKRRRRAAQGRELYKKPILVNPDDNKVITDDITPRPFKELKKEAQLINALLHAPVNKDPAIQAEIDAKNELLVTRLGIELANEADRRVKFNPKSFDKRYEKMTKEFSDVCEEIRPLREAESEARLDLREAQGKSWPKDPNFVPDEEEVAKFQKVYDEVHERYLEVQKRWEEQDRLDTERRRALADNTMKKYAKAYKAIIAEIRPVGGEFVQHSLSSEDGLKTLQETVGKDYPADWINASNKAGAMVVLTEDGRPNYNSQKPFESNDAEGMKAEVNHHGLIGEEDTIREKIRLLSEDGDKVSINGSPFTLPNPKGKSFLMVRLPERVPFNPETDKADASGKPVGEGWRYGHVLNDKFEVDGTKQWYRNEPTGKAHAPAITVTPSSNPESKTHAYHEAIHRFEDTLGNGVMTRAETAFVNRRASVNGKPKALFGMSPSDDLLGSEVAADGGFLTHYVGRIYPDSQMKEVMAVGTEAMFSGKHGAFLNISRGHGTDKDHRGFVLGMFATA